MRPNEQREKQRVAWNHRRAEEKQMKLKKEEKNTVLEAAIEDVTRDEEEQEETVKEKEMEMEKKKKEKKKKEKEKEKEKLEEEEEKEKEKEESMLPALSFGQEDNNDEIVLSGCVVKVSPVDDTKMEEEIDETLMSTNRPQHEEAYANWEEHVYESWINKFLF